MQGGFFSQIDPAQLLGRMTPQQVQQMVMGRPSAMAIHPALAQLAQLAQIHPSLAEAALRQSPQLASLFLQHMQQVQAPQAPGLQYRVPPPGGFADTRNGEFPQPGATPTTSGR